MYDRDNQEGTKTQYVYYKNIKSTDGSWSMMDAEILDMYQYDYESKEVKDLQKTSCKFKRDPLNMNSYYISGKP